MPRRASCSLARGVTLRNRLRRGLLATALACLQTSLAPGAAYGDEATRPVDCRYDDGDLPPEHGTRLLPAHDVFRPLLADMKEPRFYAGYRSTRFDSPPAAHANPGQRQIDAAVVAMGGSAGLLGFRRRGTCDGYQIGVAAGMFSQFNMSTPHSNLTNTDYLVGVPITARWGAISARLWVYHQSSHLGDDFLLTTPRMINQVGVSFEAAEALLSYTTGGLRIYGGPGYIFHTVSPMDRIILQGGAELRGEPSFLGGSAQLSLAPVAGVDVRSYEARDFGVTVSAKAGIEMASLEGRRLRLLAVYLGGYTPFGQFFLTERETNFGIEVQLEL